MCPSSVWRCACSAAAVGGGTAAPPPAGSKALGGLVAVAVWPALALVLRAAVLQLLPLPLLLPLPCIREGPRVLRMRDADAWRQLLGSMDYASGGEKEGVVGGYR